MKNADRLFRGLFCRNITCFEWAKLKTRPTRPCITSKANFLVHNCILGRWGAFQKNSSLSLKAYMWTVDYWEVGQPTSGERPLETLTLKASINKSNTTSRSIFFFETKPYRGVDLEPPLAITGTPFTALTLTVSRTTAQHGTAFSILSSGTPYKN